ncbi:MAG: hypothetical protein AAGI66_02195 [Cyanobacteria bacterium P01_H01_bin.74]
MVMIEGNLRGLGNMIAEKTVANTVSILKTVAAIFAAENRSLSAQTLLAVCCLRYSTK